MTLVTLYKKCIERECDRPVFQDGVLCREHGCYVCGHPILADSEDWLIRLCPSCFEYLEERLGVGTKEALKK